MNAPLTNVEIAADNFTANQIWDAAYERLQVVKGFKTYRRTPVLTIQPEDLPCLSVYLLRDREQPLGDPYTLEPRFRQFCHLGISGMILASNVDQQLETLADKVKATRIALYTDSSFISLISGFESTDMRLVFSRLGETAMAEYQMELVVSFETIWPPEVTDDFKILHLETAFPSGGNAEERAKIQQVIRTWDIPQ